MISSKFFIQILQIGQSKVLFNCIFRKTCLLLSAVPQRLHDSLSMCAVVSESLSVKGPCLSLSLCAAVSKSLSLSLSVCATELAVSEAATGGDARRLSPSGCHHRQASATDVRALKSSLPSEPIFRTIWKCWHLRAHPEFLGPRGPLIEPSSVHPSRPVHNNFS